MESFRRVVTVFAYTLVLTVTTVYAQSGSGASPCPMLDNPSNGMVQDDGMIATYSCDNGYPLVGNETRECRVFLATGDWYPPVSPRCGCGQPLPIANGVRMWTDTAVNSIATYTCDSGYDLEGDMQVMCNSTGEWQFSNNLPSQCLATVLMPMPGSGSGGMLMPESSTIAPSMTVPSATATESISSPLPTVTPSPTTPPPVDTPVVIIQLSFSASQDEFDMTIMLTLREILVNITGSAAADIEVQVDEELSTANTVVALVYFESTESGTGQELTQMAFMSLATTDNAAWAQLRADYSVMFQIVEVTNPPFVTDITPITLTLWQWIIVAAGGTLTMLTILITISCCCRCMILRRRPKKPTPKGYKHHKLTEVDLLHRPDASKPLVEMSAFPGHPRKVARIAYKPKGMLQQLSHPLTLEELEPLVENTSALNNEYASIPSNMVNMTEVPPGAEDKNRYRDVLPNPYTRVSLFLKFGVANSDYINANYVRGYKDKSKNYIATQGPLQWTVADFWRMVWEQRVSTIIMVTALEERGTSKCSRYWPDATVNHSTSYEDLEVRLKRRLTASNKEYTTTTFHLAHTQKMVSRDVTHFWFTGWPDHGVPASAKSVVEFLMHARGVIREMPGPTVVHCSAGIGRTGVFIGADIGMQQLDEEGQVDLLKIVSTMRQDRGGMVQTRDQYTFLHKVMLEYAQYLSQVRSTYRGGMLRGGLQPTIQEENSDTLALIT